MHKTIWLLILIFSSIYLPKTPLLAHTLKVENDVGVSLHISPDDDPIAGQEAVFYPKITDKNNQFKISDCDCKVQISQNSQVLFQTILIADQSNPSLNEAIFRYTFPAKGDYTLELSGNSFTKSFNDFQVKYDLTITKQSTPAPIETKSETTNSQPTSQTDSKPNNSLSFLQYAIIATIPTMILVIAAVDYINRRKHKQ